MAASMGWNLCRSLDKVERRRDEIHRRRACIRVVTVPKKRVAILDKDPAAAKQVARNVRKGERQKNGSHLI